MKADLYLGNFELGSTVTSVGPSGIYLNDKIADIKLDGLVLKNNQITLDIGYLKPPEFKIDTMIDFFGVEENAEVKFKEGIFEIVLQQKIHDLFVTRYVFVLFSIGQNKHIDVIICQGIDNLVGVKRRNHFVRDQGDLIAFQTWR